MARIEPLKKEEAEGEARDILDGIAKQFGMVPNIFATMAHYPNGLKAIMGLYQAIAKESTIDTKLQELANVEASRINRCNYCHTHHSQMAKAAGVKNQQLQALNSSNLEGAFSDKEKAVIEYAGAVTKDAENVPDELFGRLKSHFSESELVNLTLIIGLINVFNRFNGALGVELEK